MNTYYYDFYPLLYGPNHAVRQKKYICMFIYMYMYVYVYVYVCIYIYKREVGRERDAGYQYKHRKERSINFITCKYYIKKVKR